MVRARQGPGIAVLIALAEATAARMSISMIDTSSSGTLTLRRPLACYLAGEVHANRVATLCRLVRCAIV
jgi:hypothetical protein